MIRSIIFASLMLLPLPAFAQEPAANLSLFTGECHVWRQGKLEEAEIGQPLYVGDSLRTGKDSKAEVSFEDGTSVRISENARMLVQKADTLRSFKLVLGKLWAKVVKLSAARSQFQVETPTAVAGVRGTVFRVEVDPDSSTRVAVEEGEVEVYQPRLLRRMVRLAARREAFVRRGMEPSDPRTFDPDKEPRWERWTRKAYVRLSKILDGTLAALEKRLKQGEVVLESATKLRASMEASGRADPARLAALRRRAQDNQRQWRMLLGRGERSLRQLLMLSRRVEDEQDLASLQSQAESGRARLEQLADGLRAQDSRIMELIDRMEQETGQAPGGQDGSAAGPERAVRLKAMSQASRTRLESADPELEAAAAKLADISRELGEIRLLAPQHPLIARERFFKVRNEYFSLKQRYRGFDYPELERSRTEQRQAFLESAQYLRRSRPDEPGYRDMAESRAYIGQTVEKCQEVQAKARRILAASRAIERQLFEIAGLVK